MKTGMKPAGGNAREKAYQIIREKIINVELKPGELLNDKALAEQLEMSRTPVHEALIILSISDMVVLKPQTGTYVAPIDVRHMEVEQFIRFALEKEVISRTCSSGLTAEDKWRYEENLRAYQHYAASDMPDRAPKLLKLDNEFHKCAFMATGLERSFELQFSRLQHIERMRMLSLKITEQSTNIDDHREIYEAILNRDRERAVKRLETHLYRYRDNLRLVQDRYPEFFSLNV